MTTQGQIVEIPINSPLYSVKRPEFFTKREMLIWEARLPCYSLFDGFLVGGHSGLENYKLGQRRGIKVGGKKKPLYVIAIDPENNRLFVGAGEDHPGLWTRVLSFATNHFDWNQENIFTAEDLEQGITVEVSSSVLEEKISATLFVFEETVFLEFKKPTLMILIENPLHLFYQNKNIANTFK